MNLATSSHQAHQARRGDVAGTETSDDGAGGGSLQQPKYADANTSPPEQIQSSDTVLARSMQNLSVQERESVYEDVNGVSGIVDETPHFVDAKLRELEDCLRCYSDRDKRAYSMAHRQNEDFVTNDDFRLMFLRSEAFDVKKTADRMVRHFELKLEYWGAQKLTKRITLGDMDEESRAVFCASGSIQILPTRDNAGRAVVFAMEKEHRQHFRTNNPKVFNCRLIWYYLMAIIEDDVESQKRGVSFLGYGLDFHPRGDKDERDVWWGGCMVTNAVPLRLQSFHYCFNDPNIRPMVNLLTWGLSLAARCRFKPFLGSHEECKYELMRYGLPINVLPIHITQENEIQLTHTYFRKWLQRRKTIEANPEKWKNCIELLRINDIVCEKGKSIQSHIGNFKFHAFVMEYLDDYAKCASRAERDEFEYKILAELKSKPMDFMQYKGNDTKTKRMGFWEQASDKAALGKIRNLLSRHVASTKTKNCVPKKVRMRTTNRSKVLRLDVDDGDGDGDGDGNHQHKTFRFTDQSSRSPSIPTGPFGTATASPQWSFLPARGSQFDHASTQQQFVQREPGAASTLSVAYNPTMFSALAMCRKSSPDPHRDGGNHQINGGNPYKHHFGGGTSPPDLASEYAINMHSKHWANNGAMQLPTASNAGMRAHFFTTNS